MWGRKLDRGGEGLGVMVGGGGMERIRGKMEMMEKGW